MKKPTILLALMAGLLLLPAGRAAAQNFTNLYSFTGGSDGAYPDDGLILSGNMLYGTTVEGGNFSDGAVFAVSTNGTGFTPLHGFSASTGSASSYLYTNSDGVFPVSGLILSGDTLYGTAEYGGTNGDGTVFKVKTNGTAFTTLHSFSAVSGSSYVNSDGYNPIGSLLLSGGTLYGTATGGGSSGYGIVFALSTNGTGFTNLHNFMISDGAYPEAGLILSGNTLYGTTEAGGSGDSGTVFAIGTNGTGFTNLYDFSAVSGFSDVNSDGYNPIGSLLLLGGTLYGTAAGGGSSGYGTVFALSTNGAGFTNLYSFGGNDGSYPYSALILSGNILYSTTALGGDFSSGTVFALSTNGTGFTTLYSFTGGNDGYEPTAPLVLSANTLYGTTETGGSFGAGTVFALNALSLQFTADQASGNPPLTVNFSSPDTDNYGNALTNWSWDFGDGSTSTDQNPTYTYTIPGTFSPSLVAANNNGLLLSSSGPSITVFPPTVTCSANPTSGSVPLTVYFAAADVDSAGNPVTLWNWTFGDGSTSAAQNPSHTYTNAGLFSPVLLATNNLGDALTVTGPATITITNAPVYSGLVQNGGFATGDFTGWAVVGSVSNALDIFVDNGSQSGVPPLSGGYLAALGPVGSLSYLSQTLATSAGTAYFLSLWLDSPDGQTPNQFLVSWNGKTLFNETNIPAIGWTNLQFLVTAAGANSVLQFGFRDDPSYLGLDDISLVPAQPGIASFSLSPALLVFNGTNGLSGRTYYLLASTNLALPLSQWTPVATNVLNTNGNFTTTLANPGPSGAAQQFYILQLQ